MTNPTYFITLLTRLAEIARVLIIPFIRLGRRSKEPIDKWSQLQNHKTKEFALKWLNDGKNVGIVPHSEGLVFVDIDVEEGKTKLPSDKVSSLIEHFDTFTTQTRNGGYHLYFVNGGILQNSLLYYETTKIGELRANGWYVVAAGSCVPPDHDAKPGATGVYTVVRDVSIKTLNPNDIPEWLHLGRGDPNPSLSPKTNIGTLQDIVNTGIRDIIPNQFTNRWGTTIDQIRTRVSPFCKELDELLKCSVVKGSPQGKYGEDRSAADFRIVKILWKYWFEPTVIAAILRYHRPYEKTLRDDYLFRYTLPRAIEDAIARGWGRGWSVVPQNTPVTSLERISITKLPDNLPDKKYILVRGIPRTGKTRWAVQQLVKAPDGVFVSHRHSITRHAIDVFKKQPSTKKAVLLMGKDACCNREDGEKGRCSDCPKRLVADDDVEEGDGVSRTQYFREAHTLLHKNRVLTEREIPPYLCPHFTLKFAEGYADYCFTVPFFYANEDKTVLIKPRALVVLDEDPVVDYFYPTTIELAEYHGKTGVVSSAKNVLSDYLPSLDKLEDHISSLNRRYASDRRILDIIRVIKEEVNPIIAKLVDTPLKEYKEELVDKLNAVNFPIITEEERRETLKRVKHHLKELPITFHVSVTGLFEPILFPAQKRYLWIGHNPNTLYMVGDRTVIRPPDTEQLVIIGSTNAELLLEQLCAEAPEEAVILDIAEFPYKDNFTVFRLNGETKKHEDRMLLKFIRLLAEKNRNRDDPVPSLILTSSKKNQEHLWDRLQSAAIMSRDETADQQITNWLTGKLNIFYTNSTISRGIDLPYFDILLVHSCTFVEPFWESEIKRAQENRDLDAQMCARMIRSHLIGDELTNSVLRHTPVYGVREKQAKFIVVKSKDFGKISDKVTSGMFVVDIHNDTELRKVAATVPEMVTRASQSAVRKKVGFYDVFPVANKDSTSLKLTQVEKDTAIVLGKTREEAKAFFEKGIAAVTPDQNLRDKQYLELCEKILQYPSFMRGCKAQRRAIVRWMRNREPKVSERKVIRTLQMMVTDGTLRREMGTRNRVIYSLRKEKTVERGEAQSSLPVSLDTDIVPTHCSGAVMICALNEKVGCNS